VEANANVDLIVRPAASEDSADVVRLLNKISVIQDGMEHATEERLAREWTQPLFALAQDSRVAVFADGTIAAYAVYNNTAEPFVRPFAHIAIDPDHEDTIECGQFVAWAESRAREDIGSAPSGSRFSLLAGVELKSERILESWQAAGYAESRRFCYMQIDFNSPPAPAVEPDGISLRQMQDGEEWEVFLAIEDAFKDHFGYLKPDSPQSEFERWKHRYLVDREFDPGLQVVGVDPDGIIAGVSMNRPRHGPDNDIGWVSTLGVRRPYRRKGLGEALLRRSFELFYANGKKRAGLGVDTTSLTNATRLCEKCGMIQTIVFVQLQKVLRDGEEFANLG
jgi:mycothiol synthase